MKRSPLLALTLVAGTVASLVTVAPNVAATGDISDRSVEYLDVSVDTRGSIGGIGIGYDGPAVDPYGGYSDSITWRSDGTLMKVDYEVGPTYLKPKYDVLGWVSPN